MNRKSAKNQIKRAAQAARRWTTIRAQQDPPLGPLSCEIYFKEDGEVTTWALRTSLEPLEEPWIHYASVDHEGRVSMHQ